MTFIEEFACTDCGRVIEVGDPFIASATFPARSAFQSDAVGLNYLHHTGEVLCAACAKKRFGESELAKFKGTTFHFNHREAKHKK